MARLKVRTRKDGLVTYQVRFIVGGGRASAGKREVAESFGSLRAATTFKAAVEQAGHEWPDGFLPGSAAVEIPEPLPAAVAATVAEVAASLFEYKVKKVRMNRYKPFTLQRDRDLYRNHIEDVFGDMCFADIGLGEIADWVETQMESGASPGSIGNRHYVLFSIMKHGQKRLLLRPDNPCEMTDLPRGDDDRQIRFLQHGEWALFRSCLRLDVVLMTDLALATGLRWGEVAALRAHVIRFLDGDDGEFVAQLQIMKAWSKRAVDDESVIDEAAAENRSWKLDQPKGRKERWVSITGDLARRLQEAVAELGPEDYVFTTRTGTPWRYPDFHSDRWKPARAEAMRRGLTKSVTPHMLRHTMVVWAVASGKVDLHHISSSLGHRDLTVTLRIYDAIMNLKDPTVGREMAQQMLIADQAIVPGPSRVDVEARKIRPGARGTVRRRAS